MKRTKVTGHDVSVSDDTFLVKLLWIGFTAFAIGLLLGLFLGVKLAHMGWWI